MLSDLLRTSSPHPLVVRHLRTLALLIFASLLAVYMATLTPGVAGFDAGEFQVVPYVLGLAHPTGYPLYILIGKLWTIVFPFGSIALRMNLLSALAAAAAAALTFVLVFRLTGRATAGIVASLALGLNRWYWENALIAGVRPLHILFVVLIILLAVHWCGEVRSGADGRRILSWLALCIGAALAHHRTTFFFLPGVGFFIASRQPELLRQPQRLARLALLGLLPLSTYLYVLIRGLSGAPTWQLPVTDLPSWWRMISGTGFADTHFLFEAGSMWQHAQEVYGTFVLEFSVWMLIVAAVGFVALALAQPVEFVMLGGTFVLALLMVTSLAPTSSLQNSFSMNINWLVPVFIGLGASIFCGLVARAARQRLAVPAGLAASTLSAMAVIVWVALPGAAVIRADNSAPLTPSRVLLTGAQPARLVEDSLPRLVPNAMVMGDWMQVTAFWYYQYVDGVRPDVRVFQTTDNWRAVGEEEHKFGRSLYLTRKVPEMLGQKHLGMTGPLIQWAAETQTATAADMQRVETQFRDGFALLGYRQRLISASGWNAARPYIAQVSLWWQASHRLPKDYSVSLRLINAQGSQVAQSDSLNPVLGLYPTSQWDAGEVVEDYYELRADPTDQSEAYHVEILIYWKEPGGAIHDLPLSEGGADRLALAPLRAHP